MYACMYMYTRKESGCNLDEERVIVFVLCKHDGE